MAISSRSASSSAFAGERVADLGQRLELLEPARRGFVEPCVLDRDRGLRGEQRDELLVLGGEIVAALLLGEVQVPVGDAAEQDRNAEERAHRRVVRREPDRATVRVQVVQPECMRVADQDAEDAATTREVADPLVRLFVDPCRQEAFQGFAGLVDHPDRRVPRACQLSAGLDDALQHSVERQL